VIVPVILGAGKNLFKDVKKMDLKLVDSKTFGNRIVIQTYRPA
jgi:dihydrofolate reductase